jgi:hypothetical protein
MVEKKPRIFEKIWNPYNRSTSDLSKKDLELFKGFEVKHTSYMQVARLLDTSGCSKSGWAWMCCGVIETEHGSLVVHPGARVTLIVRGKERSISVSNPSVKKA